jgi:MFS family permease
MNLREHLWFQLGQHLPALRSRNYRFYFAGQSLSMIGNFMTQLAVLWLIYRLTDSALLLGIAGFLSQLPVFALAPISGVLADRYNRHHLMLLLQILGMAISISLTGLTFLHWTNFWVLLVLGMVLGVLKGLDVPIRHAFVTDVVNLEAVNSAISLNYAFLHTARLLGPGMGGILIANAGAGFCFLFDSLSYIAVIVALLAMRLAIKPSESKTVNPLQKLKEGFQYAYQAVPIRAILLLLATVSLVNMSYPTLLPIVSVEVLRGGADTLGFLTAAGAMGSVFASLYVGLRKEVLGLDRLIALCPVLFAIGIVVFSFSTFLGLSLLTMVLVGWSSTLQVAASNTVLQFIVEDSKRGRVMSFYTMCFMGMAPFGNLVMGSLAQAIGVTNTLIVGGGVCLLGTAVFMQQLPIIAKSIQVKANTLLSHSAS